MSQEVATVTENVVSSPKLPPKSRKPRVRASKPEVKAETTQTAHGLTTKDGLTAAEARKRIRQVASKAGTILTDKFISDLSDADVVKEYNVYSRQVQSRAAEPKPTLTMPKAPTASKKKAASGEGPREGSEQRKIFDALLAAGDKGLTSSDVKKLSRSGTVGLYWMDVVKFVRYRVRVWKAREAGKVTRYFAKRVTDPKDAIVVPTVKAEKVVVAATVAMKSQKASNKPRSKRAQKKAVAAARKAAKK
jgi:hypothetical protein